MDIKKDLEKRLDIKKDLEKRHFYSYCILKKEFIKKSEALELFLFYEFIEKTINEFPKIKDKDFIIIKNILQNIYKIIAKPDIVESYLKYIVYLEEKAEDLEEKGKKMINNFIDFGDIDDKTIKELNNLRINMRILENLFWIAARKLENNGLYLIIPHFLNIASKYIFYYIVVNYKDKLKYIEEPKVEIKFNEEKYKRYLEIYKNKNLFDFI